MIFVTVGVQLPFDRLTKAIDLWARNHSEQEVFGQIGSTDYKPTYFQYSNFLEPNEFEVLCRKADLIIAHAGMGSILTALEFGKPLLIMPRREVFGEHRNDHQLATVERFRSIEGIYTAIDEVELLNRLDDYSLLTRSQVSPREIMKPSDKLIDSLRAFVENGEV